MSSTVAIERSLSQDTFEVQPQAAPAAIATHEGDLYVTEKAVKRIRAALAKEGISPADGGLRLGIIGGGCSGLTYSVKFETRSRDRDRVYEFDGVRVFIDPKSFIYLHGMTLDCEETIMRQGFKFINPNSRSSCGCGTSFVA